MPSYRLEALTAPAVEPLSLDDVKTYLRVEHDDDDTALTGMISAARQYAELFTGRTFVNRNWQAVFERDAAEALYLPMGPVSAVSVVSVYERTAQTETVLDSGAYRFSDAFDRVHLLSPPCGDEIRVTYTAGYGADGDAVPQLLKEGMLNHIAALHGSAGKASSPEEARGRYLPYRRLRMA